MWSNIYVLLQPWDSSVVSVLPGNGFLDLLWCVFIFNDVICLKTCFPEVPPLCIGSQSWSVGRTSWWMKRLNWDAWLVWTICREDCFWIGDANTFWEFDCRVQLLMEALFLISAGEYLQPIARSCGLCWDGHNPVARCSFYMRCLTPC